MKTLTKITQTQKDECTFVTYVCIIIRILRFVHFILRACRIQETRKLLFVEDIKEGVASRMLALKKG